ncbi:MAG: ClpXP protease specificity-enhancing factor SspB [Alphaproteobacteria bacterium]|nr:ClpXP protease specificity-enhancing factor SspB [Alphaproteobacteria bacterium]
MKSINYPGLLERALKMVVKDALNYAKINGLGDNTHFYITFRTRDPGVVIPDFLRMRYPEMMTIVLQYSYSNLNVSDEEFGVTLTFDGRPFYIRIPYDSMVEFKDPSVDFMLQFHPQTQMDAGNDLELPLDADSPKPAQDDGRIISLDDYRKHRKG